MDSFFEVGNDKELAKNILKSRTLVLMDIVISLILFLWKIWLIKLLKFIKG